MTDQARAINEPLAAMLHGEDQAAHTAAQRTRWMPCGEDGLGGIATWEYLHKHSQLLAADQSAEGGS